MASSLLKIQICEMSAFEILITFSIEVKFKETMDCSKIIQVSNCQQKKYITPNIKAFALVHSRVHNRKEFVPSWMNI